MIKTAKVKLYQNPVKSVKMPQQSLIKLSDFEKLATVIGINIIAWAKIIGITPAAFTFKGIY